jgi:hypothetical protein
MATDHTGRNQHRRTGRVSPHGTGERVIDAVAPSDQEPESERLRRDPPVEYKREEATDVPGVKRKIR